ncbi:MAG: ribokinase [Verrucomicrobia bacterium]|nr:ribokinase [Verrucomicrobiota bacterium]
MRQPRVVVVGSINTDIIVHAKRLPAPGETVLGGDWIMAGGGKGANQAVAAARAGAHVTFVGRVGADLFGRESLARLRAEGIDTRHVVEDTTKGSGVALIMVGPNGENIIAVAPGANGAVMPADVDAAADAIAHADVLVAQMEVPPAAIAHAIGAAHARATAVLLNPAPAPAEPIAQKILGMINYLVPNEVEATHLTGARSLDAGVKALLDRGVGHVIITLGAKGAAVFDISGRVDVPAHTVKAVDAVGAGDAFCGVLACGIAEGLDLLDAVRQANAAAALSVTRRGAQPSMPTRDEIHRLLNGRQPG